LCDSRNVALGEPRSLVVRDLIAVSCLGGAYCDDQAAVRAGATRDGLLYVGEPRTPGFRSVRVPGEAISVGLVLEDGHVAWGDCACVTYAGAAGRDRLFLAHEHLATLRDQVAPALRGRALDSFRQTGALVESPALVAGPRSASAGLPGRARLHTALRYGLSQAMLNAAAHARGLTPAEVLAQEYQLQPEWRPVPLFIQSGDDRRGAVDKAILKRADGLPHGLITSVAQHFGSSGEILLDYCRWIVGRIRRLAANSREAGPRPSPLTTHSPYVPFLQFDVYGCLGECFHNDVGRMADYLALLESAARPHELRVEGPLDAGTRAAQIELMAALRERLCAAGTRVALVADEWCNTLDDVRAFAQAGAADFIQIKMPDLGALHNSCEAVLLCKRLGVGAYLGGSCNETDLSARLTVHVALAAGADYMLVKPGFGVDEGLMIMRNEMARTLALVRSPSHARLRRRA